MMVIPPHSSTARWVPTANPSAFHNGGDSSTFGSVAHGKGMASTKRKREDDEGCGGGAGMHAARRLRTEEITRPSIHPLQSSFNLHHHRISNSALPTPSSEYSGSTTITTSMMTDPPAGVAWLGHPLPTSSPSSTFHLRPHSMLNTPPLTPPGSTMNMLLDDSVPAGASGMQIDDDGFNGCNFPASMFTLQLGPNAVGHVHPYAPESF
ncbi:hypothetical protein CF327_g5436 [Tilletia walkeri]|nr:hypothetical protein CF327_g5436 [Tilletia walkeri]